MLFLSFVIVKLIGLAPSKFIQDNSSNNMSVNENLNLMMEVF